MRLLLCFVALTSVGCKSLPDVTFDDGGATTTEPDTGGGPGDDGSGNVGVDAATTPDAPPDGTTTGDDSSSGDDGGSSDAPLEGLAPDASACELPAPPPGSMCCASGETCLGMACAHCGDCTICDAGSLCCAKLKGGSHKYNGATCVAPSQVSSATCP
jgi:hypothetical protein